MGDFMFSQEKKWLLEEGFGGEKSAAFFAALDQLRSGTPLAYLIGFVPFLDCKIWLDSKPLIPRPETEFWVEKVKKIISSRQTPTKVLDLCAGSGCIGVAVTKNNPLVSIDFIEFDSKHLPTIEKNCRENSLPIENFRVFTGDLFSSLTTERYDFILSNPPYIDQKLNRVADSVKDHEPALALYGGEAGFEILKKIITKAPTFLNSNGELWLEHEPEQVSTISDFGKDNFLITHHQDQYNVLRFTKLKIK